MNDQDIANLFSLFDSNGDGLIDYNEFVNEMRGVLSSLRQQIVERAYRSIDKQGLGQVNVSDILRSFNA